MSHPGTPGSPFSIKSIIFLFISGLQTIDFSFLSLPPFPHQLVMESCQISPYRPPERKLLASQVQAGLFPPDPALLCPLHTAARVTFLNTSFHITGASLCINPQSLPITMDSSPNHIRHLLEGTDQL